MNESSSVAEYIVNTFPDVET